MYNRVASVVSPSSKLGILLFSKKEKEKSFVCTNSETFVSVSGLLMYVLC
jgi:hypothetical protein